MDNNRKFTEEEINQIVDILCDKITNRLYKNVGEGVFGLIWRGTILLMLGIAAYGAVGSFKLFKS